jgi:hypothetical protein
MVVVILYSSLRKSYQHNHHHPQHFVLLLSWFICSVSDKALQTNEGTGERRNKGMKKRTQVQVMHAEILSKSNGFLRLLFKFVEKVEVEVLNLLHIVCHLNES